MLTALRNLTVLLPVCLLLLAACSGALLADSALQQTPAAEVGGAIKSVDAALSDYLNSNAMTTIVLYGTDTRYYSLIRGWLLQRISGLESQTAKESSVAQQQELRFLREALRRIDLE